MLPPVLHRGPLTISNPTRDSEAEFTMIGHRFENAKDFKDALCDLAVKRNFNFRFIKNDKDRVTVTCADEDCQWRVHASRDGNLPTFRIKTTQHEHKCGGGINAPFHPRASKKWVSRKVVMKLRDRPLYRAVDIQRDILRDHGVRLPYKQAWMGKELAKGILHRSDIASYDLLVWYAAKVSETNPGSVVIIDTDGERFKRGFFCFRASLDGFKRGCRPMLFLDGTHLLGKYGGILLGATAKDGNERFFHLAFAIVDNETDDNWTWFTSTLGDAIYGDDDYTNIIIFISDRSKGLVNAIAKVFPSSPHAYCLRHLHANFLKSNGQLGKSLKDECWSLIMKIAYACTSFEYDEAVYGIPCKHACAAIMQTDTNIHRFIELYYTVESYKLTYKESIFPVPDHDKPLDESRQLRIRPPISKKRPGRPRRKRIESQAWHAFDFFERQSLGSAKVLALISGMGDVVIGC
ncbi:uncharacterized protein LOC120277657 [Dioscorea cayenensis subsp. rotundata]|uniref:Uncharacterized protein LOC120277657 n=1 Tax=Dioscorea cayennensis subsp. rotundata TaxID=55577 RepID=A0AB40CQP4_DIOCR|nr:uncharacterized protein LOC120277657 [Dioscorea cayenensis subsp. rotundata]